MTSALRSRREGHRWIRLTAWLRKKLGLREKHQESSAASGEDGCQDMTDDISAPSAFLCGVTDVGRVRSHNEDAFYVSDDGRILVVADGLGGHKAGDVASGLAVSVLVEHLKKGVGSARERSPGELSGEMERALREGFERAHECVLGAAQADPERAGMGTTLIAAVLNGDQAYLCHVGDVRGYVQNSEGLRQITQDHSVVGSLVRAGRLTPEEARCHEMRSRIEQAVGLPSGIQPETHSVTLACGDQLLLCSDGLWEAISDEEIATVLQWDGTARHRAIQLVNRANHAGGPDNITAVVYEHRGLDESP